MSDGKARKIYVEDGYYHIYNRGVEKRLIFLDEQDYGVFLSYLKDYLLPKDEKSLREQFSNPNASYHQKDKIMKLLRLNNFADEIALLAYCLMPNHFHLFIKQKSLGSIDKFMNSLGTRYTKYFNTRHKRVGTLCQSVYKAVLVKNDEQFLYLTKYIHQQALASPSKAWVRKNGQPSSYPEYLGKRQTVWVKPDEVLAFFSKTNPKFNYQNFVEAKDDSYSIENITLMDE